MALPPALSFLQGRVREAPPPTVEALEKRLGFAQGALSKVRTANVPARGRPPARVQMRRARSASELALTRPVRSAAAPHARTQGVLNLESKGLSPPDVSALAQLLQAGERVPVPWKEISLGSNPRLADDGAARLAAALAANTSLKYLGLQVRHIYAPLRFDSIGGRRRLGAPGPGPDCRIGPRGCAALARGLEANAALEVLRLDGNGVGLAGCEALAAALTRPGPWAKNASLVRLTMSRCRLTADCGALLAAALEKNRSLTKVSLNANRLGEEGVDALLASLGKNFNLKELLLLDNLPYEGPREEERLGRSRTICASNKKLAQILKEGEGEGEEGVGAEAAPAPPLKEHQQAGPAAAAAAAPAPATGVEEAQKKKKGGAGFGGPQTAERIAASLVLFCAGPPGESDDRVVEGLLAHPKCEVDRASDGGTPLYVAARAGRAALVRALLAKGADPNKGFQGDYPLHAAARWGTLPCVQALLASGADPNAADATEDRNTPLHWAVARGDQGAAGALIAAAASTEARNAKGLSPLEMTENEALRVALKQAADSRANGVAPSAAEGPEFVVVHGGAHAEAAGRLAGRLRAAGRRVVVEGEPGAEGGAGLAGPWGRRGPSWRSSRRARRRRGRCATPSPSPRTAARASCPSSSPTSSSRPRSRTQGRLPAALWGAGADVEAAAARVLELFAAPAELFAGGS
eukprot:tig00021680_g23048.t1